MSEPVPLSSVAFMAGLFTVQLGAILAAVHFVKRNELKGKGGECRTT